MIIFITLHFIHMLYIDSDGLLSQNTKMLLKDYSKNIKGQC